jgi:hypothetical protein
MLIDGCGRGSIRHHLIFVREHVALLDMAHCQLAVEFSETGVRQTPIPASLASWDSALVPSARVDPQRCAVGFLGCLRQSQPGRLGRFDHVAAIAGLQRLNQTDACLKDTKA